MKRRIEFDPVFDAEWKKLVERASVIFEPDPDADFELLESYQHGDKPIGCNSANNSDQRWIAKMYIGGKQRIICIGSVYQCARVYDVVYFRFRQYRCRPEFGKIFNLGESSASTDNINANAVAVLTDMEALLRSRKLLVTLSERKQAKQTRINEYRHARYTAAGRIETQNDRIFEILESFAECLDKVSKQLDRIEKGVTCKNDDSVQ